jgi:hypothetical protein
MDPAGHFQRPSLFRRIRSQKNHQGLQKGRNIVIGVSIRAVNDGTLLELCPIDERGSVKSECHLVIKINFSKRLIKFQWLCCSLIMKDLNLNTSFYVFLFQCCGSGFVVNWPPGFGSLNAILEFNAMLGLNLNAILGSEFGSGSVFGSLLVIKDSQKFQKKL